jgi:hypothetical protein
MDNVIFLKPKNDRERFFESEEAYQSYLKSEEELQKQPLNVMPFDWRYFLKVLFGRD